MAELNRRLAADVDDAFPLLVDEHGPMVLAIARQLGDPATAEDLTQDVLVAAYRALCRYDADRVVALRLRPWLATIARNRVRNERRRRARRPMAPGSDDDEPAAEDPALEAVGDPERLEALLARLSDPQRTAIVLRHVAGLTTAEAAEVLGCPTSTLTSHLRRGLAALRRQVAAHPDGSES